MSKPKPNYQAMSFNDKLLELRKPFSVKFRIGQGVGKYEEKWNKKIYNNYSVLAYINARDCMDRLDQIFWWDHQNTYKDIGNKAYSEVSLWDGNKWITRSDVGEPTAIAKNKGEASDWFKRACVHWWLGRFLYTIPTFYMSAEDIKENKNITDFIRNKYKTQLMEWANKFNTDLDTITQKSDYNDDGDEPTDETPDEPWIEDIANKFKPSTKKY